MERDMIDMVQIKSTILAILSCSIAFVVMSMLLELFRPYFDLILVAMITSLAMRPIKELVIGFLSYHYNANSGYSMIRTAIFFKLITLFSRETLQKIYQSKAKTFQVLVLVFLAYFLLKRMRITTLFSIVLMIVSIDFTLRSVGAVYFSVLKKLQLDPVNGILRSLLTLSVIGMTFFVLLALWSVAIGSAAFEITQKGQSLVEYLSDVVDQETLDYVLNYATEVVMQQDLTEILHNFIQDDFEFPMSQTCSGYMIYLMDLPYIGNLALDQAVYLDNLLELGGLSTGQITDVYLFYSDKINELVMEVSVIGYNFVSTNISAFTGGISEAFEKFFLFISLLYLLLDDDESFVKKVSDIQLFNALPTPKNFKEAFEKRFSRQVIGIFKAISMTSISHFLLTWMTYDILNLEFKYTLSTLGTLTALCPLFATWLFHIPTLISLLIAKNFLHAGVLGVVVFILIDYIDGEIYAENMGGIDSGLIGMAIAMGLYNYGIIGVLYGPLILSLGALLLQLASMMNKANDEEEEEK